MAERTKTAEAVDDGVCTAHCEIGTGMRRILQFKGLAGGVPPNTERTTVKPWVGIAR